MTEQDYTDYRDWYVAKYGAKNKTIRTSPELIAEWRADRANQKPNK